MTKIKAPTEGDRRVLRSRVKAAMDERDIRSFRQLEKTLGIATGTLAKLWPGTQSVKPRALTHELLYLLTQALECSPESLVVETGFEALLDRAVETPESEAVAKAMEEVDRLQAQVAAEAARADEAERRAVAAESRAASAQDRADAYETELAGLRATKKDLVARLSAAKRELLKKEDTLSKLAGKLFAQKATLGKLRGDRDRWRNHALERAHRASQVEQMLASKPGAGSVVGSGLLGFVLGRLSNGGGDCEEDA